MPQLSDFQGTWQVDRDIRDHRGDASGHFVGQAVFRKISRGLCYHETGYVSLGDQPALFAERRYQWRQTHRDIEVSFADGRPFHRILPGETVEAHHDCPPDTYAVGYDFTSWPVWQTTWRVFGPRKDYTMTTRYALASALDVGQKQDQRR